MAEVNFADIHNGKWHLAGYSNVSEEFYLLDGEYKSEDDAQLAALEQIAKTEKIQPIEEVGEMQDQIHIINPNGTGHLFNLQIHLPNPTEK